MLTDLFPNVQMDEMWTATYETLYMTIISVIGTLILGILLGLLLFLTEKGNLWQIIVKWRDSNSRQRFPCYTVYNTNLIVIPIYGLLNGND